MTHPANRIENLRRRVSRARRFPDNTCAASRHVHMVADGLSGRHSGAYADMLLDASESRHVAGSLYSVLESLWKTRNELARAKGYATWAEYVIEGGKHGTRRR